MVKEVFNGKTQKIQPRVQTRGCTTNPTGRGICSIGSPGSWNHPSMLSRWRREHEAEGQQAFRGQGNARDQELVQIKRELARVKRERDFLREAAAYFAKESK